MSGVSVESTGSQEHESITQEECFDLLSNHRRRYVIQYLQQNGSSTELGKLAEQVAAWENEIDVDELSYDERKRVYTSLQQVHLPRMDNAGAVHFDDREGVVEVGPAADDLDIYLEVVSQKDIPWSLFYFGLAAANGLIVASSIASLWPVSVLPDNGVPIFIVTSFLVASLAHLYVTRTEMQLGESSEPPSLRD